MSGPADTPDEGTIDPDGTLPVGAPVDVAKPTKIGRYAVLEVLGQGGMGTVYAAYDDQLDRKVAVKLLRGSGSTQSRPRMLREAQAMARLSHPNVVPVFEVGEHGEALFVAMEYVRGSTLARWKDEKPRTWQEIVEAYIQAGRGLAAAHAEGLVHRDFKPHNAVVGDDGRVRVLDFGLAARRGLGDSDSTASEDEPARPSGVLDTPLTATGAVMGTPAYMAPEQFRGQAIDHRSDQFSLCVSLWEALYGTRPFQGNTEAELFARVSRGEVADVGDTEVPEAVHQVLVRGLNVTRDNRWPDTASLLSALDRALRPSDAKPGRVWLQRVLLGSAVAGAAAGLVLSPDDATQTPAASTEEFHANDKPEPESKPEDASDWREDPVIAPDGGKPELRGLPTGPTELFEEGLRQYKFGDYVAATRKFDALVGPLDRRQILGEDRARIEFARALAYLRLAEVVDDPVHVRTGHELLKRVEENFYEHPYPDALAELARKELDTLHAQPQLLRQAEIETDPVSRFVLIVFDVHGEGSRVFKTETLEDEGTQLCVEPCTVAAHPGDSLMLRIQRDGYFDNRMVLGNHRIDAPAPRMPPLVPIPPDEPAE